MILSLFNVATLHFEPDNRYGLGVMWLPLNQRTRVRSPVGSVSCLRSFLGFSSTVRQMSENLGHIRPRDHLNHNHLKPYSSVYARRRFLTLTVVGPTWPSLNKIPTSKTCSHFNCRSKRIPEPTVSLERCCLGCWMLRLLSHTPAPACEFSHTPTLPEPSDSLFSSATEERCILILIDGVTENGLENTGCIHF